MTYKTIVAIIQNESDIARVLDHAFPLAERLEGHVVGVHAEPIAIPYATTIGFPDVEFMQASNEANQQRAAELEKIFRERNPESGLTAEWRALESLSGDSALGAMDVARSADLIVAAQTDPNDAGGMTASIDHLLFETGRPALFVPFAGPVRTRFSKVLVAWNGTREASRATFDALPFILEAEQTEILTVDAPEMEGNQPRIEGANIASTLTRHGAKVTVSSELSAGVEVSAVIENRAAETSADLLVMGAYGHSRLREFLFGGVTRTLLKSMPIATFMSR